MIPHSQLHAVEQTSIGNRTWSDHAPIFLSYRLSDTHSPKHHFWPLNESLLQIPEVLVEVTKTLNLYFQENDQADCDPGILWEAHKVVLRGTLISHGARIKKERNKKVSQLLQELATSEARHKHAPTQASETQLSTIRRQITDILQYRAKAALQSGRTKTYELGDKCGKLLAKTVRSHKSSTYIPHINTSGGKKASLPAHITEKFRQFYSKLYNLSQGNLPQYYD